MISQKDYALQFIDNTKHTQEKGSYVKRVRAIFDPDRSGLFGFVISKTRFHKIIARGKSL